MGMHKHRLMNMQLWMKMGLSGPYSSILDYLLLIPLERRGIIFVCFLNKYSKYAMYRLDVNFQVETMCSI